jgi:hypothetical protein
MRAIASVILLFWLVAVATAANTVTGLVRNQSRGQAAAGDEVILLRLDRGMQEEMRSKTDARGAFALSPQSPDKPYLVRVIHQNVNYDQRASVGDVLSIQVFDAASRVAGITGTIEILRAGTDGKLLHVSDMYEIVNASSPPLTQAGEHAFDVYLPANAQIDSVLAASPEKIGVMISATPVSGEPGHFALNFPLRPGATKFAVNYDLPYDGQAAFQTRHIYPLQQLAVMIPPSMKFSSTSASFELLATGNNRYQVRAANLIKAGAGPNFEISGTGALPSLRDQAKTQARSSPPISPNPALSDADRNALSSSPQINSNSGSNSASTIVKMQSPAQSLILAGVGCLFLAACTLIVWRAGKMSRAAHGTAAEATNPTQHSLVLLEGLKNELFQLETDRIDGSISTDEYASARHALQETIKRALARDG